MAQRLDNVRIVIVDDHDLVRTALAKFLSQPVAGVRTCANAHKALTQAIHFQLDLVLSDISTPGKDGFELLQKYALWGALAAAKCRLSRSVE